MKLALFLLAFALIALVGYVQIKARQNEARAEAHFPPEGQILQVQGHRVHAVVMGAGPDLVLIDGSSGNTRDFTHSLAPLLARDYRVIVFDRPGLGYSDRINRTGASISQQAALLSNAARQLGAHRPIVLGQSYGGAVALAWAVERPDALAALVLLGAPTQPWSTPLDRYYRVTSHRFLGPLVIPFITAFVDDARVETAVSDIFAPQMPLPGYLAHIGAGLTLRRDSLRANALQRANLLAEITALQPRYGAISAPVEVLHGTADTTVSLEIHVPRFLRQVPGARLTRLDGIGHMPQHVAQDQVIAALRRAASRARQATPVN